MKVKNNNYQQVKNWLLDLLFPFHCLVCKKINHLLCLECYSKIKIKNQQLCPYCQKVETNKGKPCPSCLKKITPHLDSLISACPYEEPLKSLVHKFKYNFIQKLANPLSKILTKAFLENNLKLPDIVIPVPLHPLRKRFRGFNQSELLAQKLINQIAPGMQIEIFSYLERKRLTPTQRSIKNYQARKDNLKNAFIIKNTNQIKNKSILLVDDIATTGSTLFECAKILKKNGASKVSALVLARQKIKD